jgi:hypothetical protein
MVEFTVSTADGDTVFRSGGFDATGRINGELDEGYELHHTIIDSEDEVQLYEYVMGDETGEVTTILTRAYNALKDNRIPPIGFSTTHASYDTVQIIGNALFDTDFNYENNTEGSGTDKLYYHIPLLESYNALLVNAKIHYITLPEKWVEDLFETDSPEINAFEVMYNVEENHSVIMQEEEELVFITSIKEIDIQGLTLFPNPSDGSVTISSKNQAIEQLIIYDINGKKVSEYNGLGLDEFKIDLPLISGKYILSIQLNDGSIVTKTVLKL